MAVSERCIYTDNTNTARALGILVDLRIAGPAPCILNTPALPDQALPGQLYLMDSAHPSHTAPRACRAQG